MNRYWKSALLIAPLVLAHLLPGFPGGGPSGPDRAIAMKSPGPGPRVKILTTGQLRMVRKRVIRVRVKSSHRGRIKVRGLSSTFDTNGKLRRLTKRAHPKFKRGGGSRVVKLRLGQSGLKSVRSCENREIQVRAGRSRSEIKSMVRQTTGCAPREIDLDRAEFCNFIAVPDPVNCMNPFPDNYYTTGDETTGTGRRIDFSPEAMPGNGSGVRIKTTPYNRSDGFSPGQTVVVRIPRLDNAAALLQTDPVGLADPGEYLKPDAPVLVQNAKTGERHPVWAELDSRANGPDQTNLLIHPMVNLDPGTRYIVVLRNLKGAGGNPIPPPEGFRYYRDSLPSRETAINMRRSRYEEIFRRLRRRGIDRRDLYLAWDFKVAGVANTTSRALSMRDQAFAGLGDTNLSDLRIAPGSAAPAFVVDDPGLPPSASVPRLIKGHFEVPCFMTDPGAGGRCATGARLELDPDGEPVVTGTYKANFECSVPESVGAAPAAPPGRALLYGHDLMGTIGQEIDAEPQRELASGFDFVICGTDQIGMSAGDTATVAGSFQELSGFPRVVDRLQQGMLNELLLARLMIHPDGLVSDDAFRVGGVSTGEPVIDTTTERAYYRGNGQGGIVGGALTALAPDFDRAALGAGAVNYSSQLDRSTAWEAYSAILDSSYPDQVSRPLILGILQMLWDRGEAGGYAGRMTGNPLPDTPDHEVLIDVAFGDHQVSNWQSNVLARSVGARAVSPLLDPGRWPRVDGQWGLDSVSAYPFAGSATVYFDSGPLRIDPDEPGRLIGTYPPPQVNQPPDAGLDPHEDPSRAAADQMTVSAFLAPSGKVIDACGASPCYSGGFGAP